MVDNLLVATEIGALPSPCIRKPRSMASPRISLRTSGRGSAPTLLITTAIILSALNLRTAVTSVGPVLSEVRNSLDMSAATAGVLTTLPVIAFAIFGAATPYFERRFGDRTTLVGALVLMCLGLAVRATVNSVIVFICASSLALAAGAIGNVALPSMVKRYFPAHIGRMTTAYSTALAVGAAVAAAATVPAAGALGDSWRAGLGIWALPAVVAIVPWILISMRTSASATAKKPETEPATGSLLRNKLAWMMLLAFGSQSIIAYTMFGWLPEILRYHGYDMAQAGFMMGLFTAIGIPMSIVVPIWAARRRHQRTILVTLLVGWIFGLPGLWLGGVSIVTVISVLAVAVGMGTFPLLLTLFALRTRTTAGTAKLSAFAQSGGYLMAGIGPLLVGVLLDATGSWTLPFVLLFAAMAVHLVTGWYATQNCYLEDEGHSAVAADTEDVPSEATEVIGTSAAR